MLQCHARADPAIGLAGAAVNPQRSPPFGCVVAGRLWLLVVAHRDSRRPDPGVELGTVPHLVEVCRRHGRYSVERGLWVQDCGQVLLGRGCGAVRLTSGCSTRPNGEYANALVNLSRAALRSDQPAEIELVKSAEETPSSGTARRVIARSFSAVRTAAGSRSRKTSLRSGQKSYALRSPNARPHGMRRSLDSSATRSDVPALRRRTK